MQNLLWFIGLLVAVSVVAWSVRYAMMRNRRLIAAEMQLRKKAQLAMDRDLDSDED